MFPNFSPPWESRFPRPLAPSRQPQDFRILFSVQILSYLFPLDCVYAAFLFTKCSLIKKILFYVMLQVPSSKNDELSIRRELRCYTSIIKSSGFFLSYPRMNK